jgi:hypothetical protein
MLNPDGLTARRKNLHTHDLVLASRASKRFFGFFLKQTGETNDMQRAALNISRVIYIAVTIAALAAAMLLPSLVQAHEVPPQMGKEATPQRGAGVAYKKTVKHTLAAARREMRDQKRTATSHHAHHRSYAARQPNVIGALPVTSPKGIVHGGGALLTMASADLGSNPTGWRSKWCARALNLWLAKVGFATNSANTAISFSHYGVPTTARVGAIAVMPHHVGIVEAVGPSYVTLISGNHGHRVAVGKYAMSEIIAFRAPGGFS